jgi:hypothetical protein
MKLRVAWSVTEEHSAEIEIPDDEADNYVQRVNDSGTVLLYDEELLLDLVSEEDTSKTFFFCDGREIDSVEVVK